MSDAELTPSRPNEADPNEADEIVNPEDLPSQIEVTEHAGVTRIEIADDATTRPGQAEPRTEGA